MEINDVTRTIAISAIKVHTIVGPGLLESVYEKCLTHELTKIGLKVQQQVVVPLNYDGLTIDFGYRLDLLVAGITIVEIKCVEKILPIHQAQLLSYLRLTGIKVGLIINFNVVRLVDGIKRLIV